MPLYRDEAGNYREFPQDALKVYEPVFRLPRINWNADPEELISVEPETKVWRRVLKQQAEDTAGK